MLVEHVVILAAGPAEVGGLALGEFQIFLQHRRVAREIVVGLGLRPRVIAAAALRGFFAHKLRGQLRGAVVVFARLGDDDDLVRGQLGAPGFEGGEQLAEARIARGGVDGGGEGGMLRGALLGGAGRQVDLFVPTEELADGAEAVGALDEGGEFREDRRESHGGQPARAGGREARPLSRFTRASFRWGRFSRARRWRET
jgi:hypothetical protein